MTSVSSSQAGKARAQYDRFVDTPAASIIFISPATVFHQWAKPLELQSDFGVDQAGGPEFNAG
jgi:hypothetical protein